MVGWRSLTQQRPDLARAGGELLYQHGVGLAFLATVRPDGGPRLHPVCPLLRDEGLFAFIIPSPKQRDLLRDGSFALHSFPCPDNEDAFYVTGRAVQVVDAALRDLLAEQFVAERAHLDAEPPARDHALFRLDVDSCLLTRTTRHGDTSPNHLVWHC